MRGKFQLKGCISHLAWSVMTSCNDVCLYNMVEQHVLLGRMADLKIEKLIYSKIQVNTNKYH
jgi:hypothetical protein